MPEDNKMSKMGKMVNLTQRWSQNCSYQRKNKQQEGYFNSEMWKP